MTSSAKPIPEAEEVYVKPVFEPSYYVGHIIMTVHIFIGAGLQLFQYYSTGKYRLLSVATWPWVYSGSAWLLFLAIVVYGYSLFSVAKQIKAKLEEMEISWLTLSPYILYTAVFMGMLGRLFAHLISPEGVMFGNQ